MIEANISKLEINKYESMINNSKINLNRNIRNNNFKKEWIDFVKSAGQYEYHLSLTYKFPLPESETKIYLNKLIHHLNCKLFGKNYKNNNRYLKGFVFSELQFKGTPHYHCLIKPDESFHINGKPDFKEHVLNEIQKIKKPRKTLGEPYRVFSFEGVDVIPIRDEYIVDYCTKTFRGLNDSFIGILSKDGVTWADRDS
jgi:hypothetical protein